MRFGDYLGQERAKRRWSAREAASRCGISVTRLQELEAGISRTSGRPTSPTLDLLIKLSKGFELPLAFLLEAAGLPASEGNVHLEADLITTWRSLSSENQSMALAVLRAIKSQQDAARLNDKGR